jgi:hypothetical protein
MLQELQYEDWIFMVLPYLGDDVFDELHPFEVVGEVTCFIEQTLEVWHDFPRLFTSPLTRYAGSGISS